MKKIVFILIFILSLLTVMLGVLVYFYCVFVSSSEVSDTAASVGSQSADFSSVIFHLSYLPEESPITNMTREESIYDFNSEYVAYLVYTIVDSKLHNPFLSKDTPKIEIVVDGESYFSEIKDNQVDTQKRSVENEDIAIITTKGEAINMLSSGDIKSSFQESVREGRTIIEIKAGYTKLYSKGYSKIYEDITGKKFSSSITGAIISIFN